MEFQKNGNDRAIRPIKPIKGTWKCEGLVDSEKLGRWKSEMKIKWSGRAKEEGHKEESQLWE